jgi:hypothetical protein
VLALKEQLEMTEIEKAKYKKVFSKLEQTLRSEMQGFVEEKESWKAEQVCIVAVCLLWKCIFCKCG